MLAFHRSPNKRLRILGPISDETMKRSNEKILTTHVGALPGPMEAWSGERLSDEALQLQIDDAWLAALWDRIGVKMDSTSTRSTA